MCVNLYNPKNFDPLEILPTSLHNFADDARYFVHKLYVGRIFNKRNKKSFIPLKTEYLRRIMSERKLPLIREALIKNGVVITDGYWIQGRKAIGYMLNEKFNVRSKLIEVKNKRLIKKIKLYEGLEIKGKKLDVHEHLYKYLQQVKIDYDQAILSIEDDFNINELSVAMIRDKQWFFIADKHGRVHTNISNLKSKLRTNLRWNNQTLTNIDIHNSQPFFLGILLLNYYTNKGYLTSFNHPFPQPPPSLYPLRCDICPLDVINFINLVKDGEIYEYIAVNAGNEIENRKEFKQKLFREIFFCKNKPWETEYSRLFGKLFPNVYAVIKQLKQKDYTSLAKLLQKVESSFVINGVVRRCMEKYPEMPVFTIHDSIMTVEFWIDKLHSTILEEFNRVGIIPMLRIEKYG
jgi:hypothetical protein